MKKRISIANLEPQAFTAMMHLEKFIEKSSVGLGLTEILKIRASQINGCNYCIDMHTSIAIKNKETLKRINALKDWKESLLFTKKEKSALAMTEEITLISKSGLTDKSYEEALKYFTNNEIAQLIMIIGTINMWNRIVMATHL